MAALALAAWGWGRAALRAHGAHDLALTTTVGLAALGFAGGLANLAHIAHTPVLWALLAIGWALAAKNLRKSITPSFDKLKLAAMLIAAAMLGLFLLPSAAFNPGDDLQLYFYRPMRMLQAGTLGGDPFDPLGFDSLGLHASLQSFTLLGLPLAHLNALDAVLCATLAIGMVFELGRALGAPALVQACAAAALVLVHPQQVNVSSVYGTVMFSMALALAIPGSRATPLAWAPTGLLAAALLASKATNVLYTAPFVLALIGASCFEKEARGALLRGLALCCGWTALFLAPWLLLSGGKYLGAWHAHVASESVPTTAHTALLAENMPLHWGASVYAYDVAAAIAAAGAAAGWWLQRRSPAKRQSALPAAALCAAAITAFVFGTLPFDIQHAVRYSTPFLIAGSATGVLLIGGTAGGLGKGAGVAAAGALAIAFGSSVAARGEKLVDWRTTLAEPGDMAAFAAYTSWSLGTDTREWVRRAQAHVPPGERVLALIACPHHLLFARNPVYVASEFGLTMPWLGMPLDADASQLRRFLQREGVRYVMWQVGSAMKTDERLRQQLEGDYPEERRLARFLLSFRDSLRDLTRAGRIVYQENGLFVVEVGT